MQLQQGWSHRIVQRVTALTYTSELNDEKGCRLLTYSHRDVFVHCFQNKRYGDISDELLGILTLCLEETSVCRLPFDALTSFLIIYNSSVTNECFMIPVNQSILLHPQTDQQGSESTFLHFFFFLDSITRCAAQVHSVWADGERLVYNRSQY